jgi:hypothetical protein
VPAPQPRRPVFPSVQANRAGPPYGRVMSPRMSDPLPRLRALCLALPEVTEKVSHGEPTWFVRKTFVTFADRHHDDRLAFWCAAPPGVQEELVAADPARFFRPPYVGGRGWLGVYLDVPDVDWTEIEEIVTDAYRQVAPKRLASRLDEPA